MLVLGIRTIHYAPLEKTKLCHDRTNSIMTRTHVLSIDMILEQDRLQNVLFGHGLATVVGCGVHYEKLSQISGTCRPTLTYVATSYFLNGL